MKSLKTEVLAGLTTFLTMSYIIIVNPAILSTEGTGMSFSGVLSATILVSFLSTLLMGLFAKLPFALAPGMGINAFFTYTLILGEKIPWQQALGMTFYSGVFFVIISLTPLREKIAKAIPLHLRFSLACGIGLFLSFIGLKNGLLITSHPETFLTHAPFSFEMATMILGLLIIIYFSRRKNPASFLIGIATTTLLSLIMRKAELPKETFLMPDFKSVFFQVDFLGSLKWAYLPSIFTLVVTDLFDSLSTFIGVSEAAGLVDEKNEPKNMKKALFVDAIATLTSSLFGTSAATTYIESASGVEAGGKTGLTAIVTAFCFLPFLFLSPLIQMIPSYATAPVLIFVGIMMFKNIVKIDFHQLEMAIPAFFTIILIPLTFSITQGILWGLSSHVILYILFGRRSELNSFTIFLGVASIFLIIN